MDVASLPDGAAATDVRLTDVWAAGGGTACGKFFRGSPLEKPPLIEMFNSNLVQNLTV